MKVRLDTLPVRRCFTLDLRPHAQPLQGRVLSKGAGSILVEVQHERLRTRKNRKSGQLEQTMVPYWESLQWSCGTMVTPRGQEDA